MAGLYFTFSNKKKIPEKNYTRFFSHSLPNVLNEEYSHTNFIFGRSTPRKFLKDRFLFENEDYVFGIEGIIYNSENPKEYITALYPKLGVELIKKLKGQFSGFIYDKLKNIISVFTDPVSSKPIYYHISKKNELFCLASEGKAISSLLTDLNLSVNIDIDSIKSLLLLGFLLDDSMPVKEISKLKYGSILTVDLNTFDHVISPYFRLTKNILTNSKEDIVEEIDHLLIKSVDNEWKKDTQNGYGHFSFLSGGLDSRVNLILAKKLGYDNVSTLTFSEENTYDKKIAREISTVYNTSHTFVHLDGSYLFDSVPELIKANDGLASFFGAAHQYDSVKKVNLETIGAAHSGQIGDVLFGSFSNKVEMKLNDIHKIGIIRDPNLTRRIERLPELIKRYDFEGGSEIFAYEQRQFNLTMNGDRTSSHFFDITSPFYDKDLIQYCLNIPPQFKRYEAIYLDWFNKKHPEIAKFKWQKIGLRPTSLLKLNFGLVLRKFIDNYHTLINRQYDNMNPFDSWFLEKPELKNYYTKLFNENVSILKDKELKQMAELIFKRGDAKSMMNAVSAIFSVKLYLNQLE